MPYSGSTFSKLFAWGTDIINTKQIERSRFEEEFNGIATGLTQVGTFASVSSTIAQGDVLYGSAAGTIARLAKNTTATRYLSNTGTSNNPAWAQVDLTNGVTGVLPSANGGVDTSGWSSYTPSISAASGTFTSVSASGKYKQIGKTTFVHMAITITTNGTAAGHIIASTPSSCNLTHGGVFYGRADVVSGKMLQGIIGAGLSAVNITNYDNTYPGASGETIVVQGTYEHI
jgi:hypothetical protein